MITKSSELAALAALADTLGPDSYIGPWIREILPFVEQDLRSDIRPAYTLADARARTAKIEQDAKDRASQIIVAAERDAERIQALMLAAVISGQQELTRQAEHLRRLSATGIR